MTGGEIFLIVWFVALVSVLSIFVVRSRRFTPNRILGDSAVDGSESIATFIGGARWPMTTSIAWRPRFMGCNATTPLIRLSLLKTGVRLEHRYSLFNGVAPFFWEAPYSDLTEVQAVGTIALWNTGIRFRSSSDDRWVIFWTNQRDRVLDKLREQGVQVEPIPVKFRFMNPGL